MNFTNCEVDKFKVFGGANGSKIGIVYNNENYMIKFPSKAKLNVNISYSNSVISEYIGCKVFKLLGFDVQEVMLGIYEVNGIEKLVVACKNIESNGYVLKDFALLKNATITSESLGYSTDIEDIIDTFEKQTWIDVSVLKKHFFEMFVVDALLGNFDRHNGNWGFLIKEITKNVKLAPIFDCGSCLYPQIDDDLMKKVLENEDEKLNRVYEFPTSAIKYNGSKINYVDFIKSRVYKECDDAILNIGSKIDLISINKMIDEIDCISDLAKEFYKEMIRIRKEIIFG